MRTLQSLQAMGGAVAVVAVSIQTSWLIWIVIRAKLRVLTGWNLPPDDVLLTGVNPASAHPPEGEVPVEKAGGDGVAPDLASIGPSLMQMEGLPSCP